MSARYMRDVARGIAAGMIVTALTMGAAQVGIAVGVSMRPDAAATSASTHAGDTSPGNFNPGAGLDTSQVEHGETCQIVPPISDGECAR